MGQIQRSLNISVTLLSIFRVYNRFPLFVDFRSYTDRLLDVRIDCNNKTDLLTIKVSCSSALYLPSGEQHYICSWQLLVIYAREERSYGLC